MEPESGAQQQDKKLKTSKHRQFLLRKKSFTVREAEY